MSRADVEGDQNEPGKVSVDAEAIACTVPIEAERGPEQTSNLVALQIAFAIFGHFRKRDDHRAIEPLVPPAPIQRSRERHQLAFGRRRFDGPAVALGGALVRLSTAPFEVFVATFRRDFGDQSITEEFSKPFDFKREPVGTRNGRAVLLAVDRKAVADQDLIGITVAEGRLSIFDEVFRERNLSFAAVAFASACADFPLSVLDDPDRAAAFAGAA